MDQEFKNVKGSVNETNGTLNNLKSSLQGFKSQVHEIREGFIESCFVSLYHWYLFLTFDNL